MLAWCSIVETMISSPGPIWARPYELATRLMPSVVPRRKTMSSFARRVEEAAGLLAAALEQVGGPRRQRVRGPVDVRVVAAVEVARRVDDALRLVGGGGVVEPDQPVAVDALVQGREIPAHALDVEGRRDRARSEGERPRGRAVVTRRLDPRRAAAAAARWGGSEGSSNRPPPRARTAPRSRRPVPDPPETAPAPPPARRRWRGDGRRRSAETDRCRRAGRRRPRSSSAPRIRQASGAQRVAQRMYRRDGAEIEDVGAGRAWGGAERPWRPTDRSRRQADRRRPEGAGAEGGEAGLHPRGGGPGRSRGRGEGVEGLRDLRSRRRRRREGALAAWPCRRSRGRGARRDPRGRARPASRRGSRPQA